MLERMKKKREARLSANNEPSNFTHKMAELLEKKNVIDSDLYIKHNVKRGLRNSNGTGVVVGLTRIGEVLGYRVDENKEKIPMEGKLYYRGYSIEELVRNCIDEGRFGFEEITYLLIFGQLPTQKQLNDFNALLGEKRELPMGFARDMILTAPSSFQKYYEQTGTKCSGTLLL